MKSLIKSKKFRVGVLIGIILIILLNIFFPSGRHYDPSFTYNFGFPFTFYQSGHEEMEGGSSISRILWLGLIGNLLFTIFISFLAGLSLNLLADKEPKLT